MHNLRVSLQEQYIRAVLLGPKGSTAVLLCHIHGTVLAYQACIQNQQTGARFVFHLEKNSLMTSDAQGSCSSKLNTMKFRREGRHMRYCSGTPPKKFVAIAAHDLQCGWCTEKTGNGSPEFLSLEHWSHTNRNHKQNNCDNWEEKPCFPNSAASPRIGTLMSQTSTNPTLQVRTLREFFKRATDHLILRGKPLELPRAGGTALQMPEQRLKSLRIAFWSPGVHLHLVELAIHHSFPLFNRMGFSRLARLSCKNLRARE